MLSKNEFYRDLLYHDSCGDMIHSGDFTGTLGSVAKLQVTKWLKSKGFGEESINYRIRDWLISRQRYWGAPIPMVHCDICGWQPVPQDQLPVLLPDDVAWKPTGESPLKLHPTWKNTICPHCGGPAERETDTMDTFMCSSWYHLRYLSPDYAEGPFDPDEYLHWMPVDTYTGGIEHATMHLIYTRFFHKALRDMEITHGPEPMLQLRNQGMVLGEDHEKMSKSRGNVIAPDELVRRYGADTVRAYLIFFARWDMGAPWNSSGIEGTARWIRRVWSLFTEPGKQGNPDRETLRNIRRKVHTTLQSITRDFETFQFNTIVSSLMELLNELARVKETGVFGSAEWEEAKDIYLRMMAPVVPHIAEELWSLSGKPYSVHTQTWPIVDEEATKVEEITVVLQVNGKVRDRINVPVGIGEEEIQKLALGNETIQRYLGGKEIRKVILVPGKLINLVV
jgi:leucyl-tRNA synthetase